MESLINYFTSLVNEAVWVFNEMALYLLLGFVVAGLLHSFFPRQWIVKRMSEARLSSNIWAAVFGIPLPLCSCSVLPATEALQKSGASKGATVSFLTATPQTGVDSILVTYSFFAWPLTLFKLGAALVSGILGGLWVNASGDERHALREKNADQDFEKYMQKEGPQDHSIGAFSRYAFEELPLSLRKWMLWGVFIAALISTSLPANLAETLHLQENPWLSYIAFLLIGLPMYVCSTGSLPIAASLIAKGFSPGGAFVFLMVGPATNAASITMLYKTLGRKHLLIFLTNLIVITLLFAALFDYLFPNMGAELTARLASMEHAHHQHEMGWLEVGKWAASIALLLLFTQDLIRRLLFRFRAAGAQENQAIQQWDMQIDGLHCGKCVARATSSLLELEEVESADVQLDGKGVVWIKNGNTAELERRLSEALKHHDYKLSNLQLKK